MYDGEDSQGVDLNRYQDAYSPSGFEHKSSILQLTDPEDDLYKFELFLRSLKSLPNGETVSVGKPLLNNKGINSVMAAIESVVHHMNALSNFTADDILYLHETLKDNLILDLMVNSLDYDVERQNRDLIVGNALRFAYTFMKRAFEEGDRRFWKGTTQEVLHKTEQSNSGKSGVSMNPFRMFKK